ncbi:MAG: hypothetical protein JXA96_04825 [Sedimentisphaerales bacterium]|nr:hypothetical protein [Sedimentisphaerales bacterium]
MGFLKEITILLLACVSICQVYAQGENNQSADEWLLMNYLSQGPGSSVPKTVVQELINKGQVFFLEYKRDVQIKDESDRKNQQVLVESLNRKGVFTVGISDHRSNEIYPGISATFSKLSNYNNPEPRNWLEQMKEPIEAGYELKSVRIIYQPSMEIKTHSYEKSREIIAKITNELQKISSEYEQFSDFNNAIISVGALNDDTRFPTFPSLFYRYGYGQEVPNTKGSYEKTTENWCTIRIGYSPVNGFPKAQDLAGKTFSRQGIEAYWEIESENQELNTKVSDIVIKCFASLDEFERELEKSLSASSTATRLKENAEKLKESDRELNEKWDLPDDVIDKTSTDKLFLHFINSPVVAMLMIYDTPEPGLTRLLNANHTLREFYNRDDMAQGALKMYKEYDLSPESMTDEEIRGVFSRNERILENPETQNLLAPNNIVNMKIAHITMRIMYADQTLLSKQFFPKLKGYEREFLKVMLERYEKIVTLREKYGEDFGPAATYIPQFCLRMSENLDKEFYNKLSAIEPFGEGQGQFMEEVKNFLENFETGNNDLQTEVLLSSYLPNYVEQNQSDNSIPLLIVRPVGGLEELIEKYENGTKMPEFQIRGFEQLREKYLDAKKNGQTRWNSQNWMKDPNYYKSLDTLKLAEECFSGSLFANEMGIYNDPAVGLESLKIFHNGFAELFNREDMWKGILHVYDVLSLKLDPKADLRQIVMASGQLDAIYKLYSFSPLREQAKGQEKILLDANFRTLKRFVWYIENYDSEKMGGSSGFFCEPCSVAQVALMLAKQVNAQKYNEIINPITSVRCTREQKIPELKAFLELVISSLEGFVAESDEG